LRLASLVVVVVVVIAPDWIKLVYIFVVYISICVCMWSA